eukprot:jgi/Mesen1/7130/ME000369S06446
MWHTAGPPAAVTRERGGALELGAAAGRGGGRGARSQLPAQLLAEAHRAPRHQVRQHPAGQGHAAQDRGLWAVEGAGCQGQHRRRRRRCHGALLHRRHVRVHGPRAAAQPGGHPQARRLQVRSLPRSPLLLLLPHSGSRCLPHGEMGFFLAMPSLWRVL